MSYSPVNVPFASAALSADINQLQENITHCLISMGTQNLKVASGKKEVSWLGSIKEASATITFATDSDWGDPGFTSPPKVFAMLITTVADVWTLANGDVVEISVAEASITNLLGLITLSPENTPPANDKRFVWWFAVGV